MNITTRAFKNIPMKFFSSSVNRWELFLKTSRMKTQKLSWYFIAQGGQDLVDSITCWAFLHKHLKTLSSLKSLASLVLWQTICIGTTSIECLGTEVTHPWKETHNDMTMEVIIHSRWLMYKFWHNLGFCMLKTIRNICSTKHTYSKIELQNNFTWHAYFIISTPI